MSEEREDIEEVEELEGVVEESVVEEGEAEVTDLLTGLDQISTMIYVTEIWDSVVSGKISVEEARKLLNRSYTPMKGIKDTEEEEEEIEEEAKKARTPKKTPKKKSKG